MIYEAAHLEQEEEAYDVVFTIKDIRSGIALMDKYESHLSTIQEEVSWERLAEENYQRLVKLANEWMCELWNCGIEFPDHETAETTYERAMRKFSKKYGIYCPEYPHPTR